MDGAGGGSANEEGYSCKSNCRAPLSSLNSVRFEKEVNEVHYHVLKINSNAVLTRLLSNVLKFLSLSFVCSPHWLFFICKYVSERVPPSNCRRVGNIISIPISINLSEQKMKWDVRATENGLHTL